jgi:hypothetical protein
MVRHKIAKLYGPSLVDESEAFRRAELCVKCPNNVSVEMPCGSLCGELKTLVALLVGSKSTPYDERLKSCAICACYNSVAVWVPLDVQTADLTEEQRSQFQLAAETVGCWKSL